MNENYDLWLTSVQNAQTKRDVQDEIVIFLASIARSLAVIADTLQEPEI